MNPSTGGAKPYVNLQVLQSLDYVNLK